jgi:hypothetical protein
MSSIVSPSLIAGASLLALEDDFAMGGATAGIIGSLGWGLGAGTVSEIPGEAEHPGIKRLDSTAASGTVARVSQTASQILLASQLACMEGILRPNTGTAVQIRFGGFEASGTAGEGSNGVYFSAVNGGNWRCVCKNAAGTTATASSVPATAAAWARLKIAKVTGGFAFYINGALVATITDANVPGAAIGLFCAFVCETNSAAAKTLDIDYFSLMSTALAR